MHISIDFETRSRCSIKRAGAWGYSQHPSTRLLCFAFRVDQDPVQIWRSGENPHISEDPFPQVLIDAARDTRSVWHAWNAPFEIAIWSNVVVPRYGLPDIPLEQWDDTAARGATRSIPRDLEGAAVAMRIARLKDASGHLVMMQMSQPRPERNQQSKACPGEFYNDQERYEKLYKYCVQDVEVETELLSLLPPLHWWERELWLLDQRINRRGVPVDEQLALAAIRIDKENLATRKEELFELTSGEVSAPTQTGKLLEWLNRRGVNIADLRAETLAKVVDSIEDPVAKRGVEIRIETSRASIAKYRAIIDSVDADGRCRDVHQYYGANTGRWAGRRVQFQNVPRIGHGKLTDLAAESVLTGTACSVGLVWDDVSECLVKLIRSTVCAPPGRELAASDYSQIESRVLCWCAGQQDMLDVFAAGGDVYRVMAGRIYGISPNDVTDSQRQRGKIAVLGLGYGMGAARFVDTAAKSGVALTAEESERIVKLYRETHPAVTRWWYLLNQAAISAVKKTDVFAAGPVSFRMDGRWLQCVLPSGRSIYYCEPKVSWVETAWGPRPEVNYMSVEQNTRKWCRKKTYGAMLAENIVQAISRDLLANAMLRLDLAGYEIVFHVHDEIVLEVPAGGQIGPIETIMNELPNWAVGLPLTSKGYVAKRYRK